MSPARLNPSRMKPTEGNPTGDAATGAGNPGDPKAAASGSPWEAPAGTEAADGGRSSQRNKHTERSRGSGGTAARRAMVRWSWRLFRREWRQQLLVLGMISVAVAATIVGAGIATNTPPPTNAGFGTANNLLTLPGNDLTLRADLAGLTRAFGTIDVIENQTIATGLAGGADLRSQDPNGAFGRPMLRLLSGSLPQTANEVDVTKQLASTLDLHLGGTWTAAGRTWQLVGLVENPQNLLDNFALVAPGQLAAPSQVTVLFRATGDQVTSYAFPAGASPVSPSHGGGLSPAFIVLAIAIVSLIFIGLVASASFAVLAQRRLRSLGMVSSLGATDRNVRLVMVASGAVVGVVATAIGAAVGLAAWVAYVPRLSAGAHHRITWTELPWWLVATGMALAVVTSILASRRPARAISRVPVVSALSGRPAPPKPLHRSAIPGIVLMAGGFSLLIASGGWSGGNAGEGLLGLLAVAIGVLLLTPVALSLLGVVARRVPVAGRIALRDLARYRARSGAALAATSFAVFMAVVTALVATGRYADPVDYFAPNLPSDQLIVSAPPIGFPGSGAASAHPGKGGGQPLATSASPAALANGAHQIAASLGTSRTVELESAPVDLSHKVGTQEFDSVGQIYLATPAVLEHYGIDPASIASDTLLVTSRPALASTSHLALGLNVGPGGGPGAIADPKIQTFHQLPTDSSDPNLLITEAGAQRLGIQSFNDVWLVEAGHGLTAQQVNASRTIAAGSGLAIETKNDNPSLAQLRNWATAAGVLIALGVLAMTVGLIRSETAGDLRTLAATGASSRTRRAITATTAGALALLAGVLGTAAAYVAVVAFFWSQLAERMSHAPALDLVAILIGLPVVAAAGGWLFAGRQPPALARRPVE
ncbi:MAG: FtsX-like permease family protein [Acidimicrobiales bacterium]